MRCPLHGRKIDPFLVHFPQWGKFTQFADFFVQQFDGVIDFFLGVEAAQGERIELWASSSLRPRARRTYEGSSEAEVQAEPEETARSLIAIIIDSPST